MLPHHADRLKIELEIYHTGKTIPFTSQPNDCSWLLSQEANDYLKKWYELIEYYRNSSDFEIGVIALSEYMDFSEYLKKIIDHGNLDSETLERLEDYLDHLGWRMDEVIKEMSKNYANR
jgi:hypothetical protein